MLTNSDQKGYIAIKLTAKLKETFKKALLCPLLSEYALQQIQSDLDNSIASISTLKLLNTVLTDDEPYSAMQTSRLLFPNSKSTQDVSAYDFMHFTVAVLVNQCYILLQPT